MAIVALNVAALPSQIDFEGVVILMTGVNDVLTDVVILFDTAFADVTHVSLLVSKQLIISLSAMALEVNVAVLAPVLMPFIFH